MIVSKEPRKHHIVPRTYLELFAIGGSNKVAILDLDTMDIREQRPSEVLHIRDYYRQRHAPEGKDQFALEKAFATHIEYNLPTIIRKLERGGQQLSEDELIQFINYLQIQRVRVPKLLDRFMGITQDIITSIAHQNPSTAADMDKYRLRVVVKDEHRFNILRSILVGGTLFRVFSRMIWTVWRMPDAMTLVTSDCPVVVFNPALPGEQLSGPGLTGAHVLFPLSPHSLLELVHPELDENPNVDPLRPIRISPVGDVHIQLRAHNTLPIESAKIVNEIVALHAQRYVVANNRDNLKKLKRPNRLECTGGLRTARRSTQR